MMLLQSYSMSTRLSLGSLSLVWDLTMKNDISLPYTNWLGVGVILLMSSKQGETSQYRGKRCDVID